MDAEERLQEINDHYAGIMLPVICIIGLLMLIGLIGNPLVIYFYGCRMKPTASYMFIVTLACFDLLSCLVSMPLEMLDLLYFYTFESLVACKILRFINVFAALGSGVTLVAIAVDRFRKICKPFEAQITNKLAKIVILIAFIFSLFSSWPSLLLYSVVSSNITDDAGVVANDCRYIADDSYALYIIIFNGYFMLLFAATIIILTVIYVLVGRQLFHLRTFRFYATKSKTRPMSAMTNASDARSCSTGFQSESCDLGNTNKSFCKELEIEIERAGALSPISEDDVARTGSRPASANSIAISARSMKLGPHRISPSTIDQYGNDILPPEEFRSPSQGQFRQTQSFTEKTESDTIQTTPRRANSAISGQRTIPIQPHGGTFRESQAISRVTFSHNEKEDPEEKGGETRDAKAAGSIDQKKMRSQNINTRRYTIIAISISMAFVFSFLPYLVLIIWSTAFYDYDPYNLTPAQLATCELFFRSFLFNGALNPVIYGFLNSEFKDMVVNGLKRLCCCCCDVKMAISPRKEHSST